MAIPGNAPTLTQVLLLGSAGPEVRSLQGLLNGGQNGSPLTLDGRFGKTTLRSLTQFQRRHGLKPDGMVGPKTAAALGWNYAAPPPLPYTIRMDKLPLPGTTPPLVAIGETIRGGLDRYKTMILQEVAKNAVSENGRRNATNDIENMLYPHLMHSLDNFLQTRAHVTGDAAFDNTAREFDMNLFKLGLANFNRSLLMLGQAMKEAGWQTRSYAEVIDRSDRFDDVPDIAMRLVRGEQSAAITAAQIRLAFQAGLGFY